MSDAGDAIDGNCSEELVELDGSDEAVTAEEAAASVSEILQFLSENTNTNLLDLKGRHLGLLDFSSWLQVLESMVGCAPLSVDLTNNDLQDSHVAQLIGKLRGTRTLVAAHNCIGSEHAEATTRALQQAHGLTSLNLDSNNIDNEDAVQLLLALRHGTVLSLGLGNNVLGGEGVVELAKQLGAAQTLTSVDLSFNGIGDDGARSVVGALTNSRSSLTAVDLSYNGLTDDGVAAVTEALKENTTLTTLNVADEGIDGALIESLAKKLDTHRLLRPLAPAVHHTTSETATLKLTIQPQVLRITSLHLEFTSATQERWQSVFDLAAPAGCAVSAPAEFTCRAMQLQPATLYLFRARARYASGPAFSDVVFATTAALALS